jgi:hypothetical protein
MNPCFILTNGMRRERDDEKANRKKRSVCGLFSELRKKGEGYRYNVTTVRRECPSLGATSLPRRDSRRETKREDQSRG